MNQPSAAKERLYAIVEQGLCIGCGLCQSIAGGDRVRVCKTQSGYEQPVVEGELDHATVDRIYAACPGTRIEGLPERLHETAYALACDVAAADERISQEELRLLELLRHRLSVGRLPAAAIERGARARHLRL